MIDKDRLVKTSIWVYFGGIDEAGSFYKMFYDKQTEPFRYMLAKQYNENPSTHIIVVWL